MTDEIPTPITDAAVVRLVPLGCALSYEYVDVSLAHQLERDRHQLREACRESLLVLATLKITDDEKPYREIAPLLRSAIRRAHDAALSILAATEPKK